jgi:hypothetical protein
LTQQLRLPWEEKKTFVEGVKNRTKCLLGDSVQQVAAAQKKEMGEKKLEKRTISTARTTQNAVKTNAKRPQNSKNATAFYERWSNYILPF